MDFGTPERLWSAIPDTTFVVAVLLLSLRLSAVLLMTPILGVFGVPAVIRVLLVVALSTSLVLGMARADMPAADLTATGALLFACCAELALGATLALGVLAAFGAISFAGRLLDVQVGFGLAQVLDPVSQRQVPILTAAFDRLGVIVFFLLNGHHALLRGMAYSLERFPLGQPWPLSAAAPWVIKQVGGLFALGFALAAPVVACLLMVELALGVLSRNLPQMNMLVVGMPVKIVAGLAALSLWVAGMGDSMSRIYGSIYRTWDAVFASVPSRTR